MTMVVQNDESEKCLIVDYLGVHFIVDKKFNFFEKTI